MKKVLTVFGTRPEAIKMAPIVKGLERQEDIESIVCITGQHREMLDQVLQIFDIKPDYDLNIFEHGQGLSQITSKALLGMEDILKDVKPDLLLIQGDTSTVFSGALAAFYHQVPVGHVEAGLRSGNIYSPYPEEANRMMTGILTELHFAPTEQARKNLLAENYDEEKIFITGNTVIDALLYTVQEDYEFENEQLNKLSKSDGRLILLTSHRRENWGAPMKRIFESIKRVVQELEDVEVVFPVHLNPKVRDVAEEVFGDEERVHLVEPLSYEPFTNLMAKADLVVSDSGGIQEEAPTLGKPVLVIREETERPEGIEAGTAKLVGTNGEKIYSEIMNLLTDKDAYDAMANAVNPYGDGQAAEKIVKIIKEYLK